MYIYIYIYRSSCAPRWTHMKCATPLPSPTWSHTHGCMTQLVSQWNQRQPKVSFHYTYIIYIYIYIYIYLHKSSCAPRWYHIKCVTRCHLPPGPLYMDACMWVHTYIQIRIPVRLTRDVQDVHCLSQAGNLLLEC